MKLIIKNLILVFLFFLVIAALFSLTEKDYFEKPEEVSLTKLVSQIEKGKVDSITVESDHLTIFLKGGKKETALKEKDASLTTTLKNMGLSEENIASVEIKNKGASGWNLFATNILPILLPFVLIGAFFWFMFRQARRGQSQAFMFGKTKARLFSGSDKDEEVDFDDVGGIKEAKEELKEVIEFLKDPQKFLSLGAKPPRGILLVGPPGCGKTLLARAVANEANVPFFNLSASEFIEMFVGVGASRVRDTFKVAKKNAPSILFIDELDAIGRQRGAGLGGGHDEREQTLNQILSEMDGFKKDTKVIVMAATNRPDILDSALLRPGRFDRKITIDSPDIKDREEILKIHARNKPLAQDVDLQALAERTPGFSGADLENLINEAAILTAMRGRKKITQDILLESVEKVLLGRERESHILTEEEKKISAYHEAGHALVAASLPETDPVHKVSIVSRGQTGGYTLKLPTQDKHFKSRREFLADLASLLGGYAAEKIVFNDLTTGASNDLQKASDMARKIVTRYGMSEKLGPVTFGKREELVFLGKELHEDRNYSEEIAAKIDAEVSRLIKNAYQKARAILERNKKKLKEIANILIKRETIEREEFQRLVGDLKPAKA